MTSEKLRTNPMFLRNQFKGEDAFTAHKTAIKFLEMYRDELGFEIDEYIKRLTLDMYKEEFDSLA